MFSKLLIYIYICPLNKTLPRRSAFLNWISARFYETDWPVSQNLTQNLLTNAFDFGKVLWSGRIYKIKLCNLELKKIYEYI